MPQNAAYTNAIANHGRTLMTHIGLVNGSGTPLAGARQAVTWTTAPTSTNDGLIRPSADLPFAVAAGETVAGWQGYSALTAGTAYGVNPLTAEGPYGAAGTYTLTAASTGVDHNPA